MPAGMRTAGTSSRTTSMASASVSLAPAEIQQNAVAAPNVATAPESTPLAVPPGTAIIAADMRSSLALTRTRGERPAGRRRRQGAAPALLIRRMQNHENHKMRARAGKRSAR